MYTPIELDKTRNLRYSLKAIALIERKLGKNFASINFQQMSVDEIMTVLWGGLVHEDPELTPDKLLDIVDGKDIDLTTIISKTSDAIDEAFPDENPTQATAE